MPYIERYGVGEDGDPAGVRIPMHVGDIVFSPLATPREGTLVCDGSAVSRQAYKALFDFLGTSCGEGDGETTFNLPDLRDVWILCAGTEHEAGDSVVEGLPNITGSVSAVYAGVRGQTSGAMSMSATSPNSPQVINSNAGSVGIDFNAHDSNPIYGSSAHVTPASVAVLPCIVYE